MPILTSAGDLLHAAPVLQRLQLAWNMHFDCVPGLKGRLDRYRISGYQPVRRSIGRVQRDGTLPRLAVRHRCCFDKRLIDGPASLAAEAVQLHSIPYTMSSPRCCRAAATTTATGHAVRAGGSMRLIYAGPAGARARHCLDCRVRARTHTGAVSTHTHAHRRTEHSHTRTHTRAASLKHVRRH